MTTTRLESNKGLKMKIAKPKLNWARGPEGIFLCDLRQLNRSTEAILFNTNPPALKLEETDLIVQSWLLQLGLTNRETVATLAMARMNRQKREEAIKVCMNGLSMTENQISSALKSYSECAVIEKDTEELPKLDSYEEVIKSLRAMKIKDPVDSVKRKRIESNGSDNCSISNLPNSGKLKQNDDSETSLQLRTYIYYQSVATLDNYLQRLKSQILHAQHL